MKSFFLLIAFTASVLAATNEVASTNLFKEAELVIRAEASPAEKTKYLWFDVEVLTVLKNDSQLALSNRLHVASTHDSPLPKGSVVLYLERFEKQTPGVPRGNWRVIGRDTVAEKK